MSSKIAKIALAALACAGFLAAQQPAQQPPAAGETPVAKQPKLKGPKEQAAVQAMFGQQTPDQRIAAAKNVITNFADSEFRPLAWQIIAATYQQKGDEENMITACEELLKLEPKNFNAKIMIASSIARRTREFDFDKEDKLARAEKMAKEAQADITTAPRPNPQISEAQWTAAKKDFNAQVFEALALAAMARKNYPAAIDNFKKAMSAATQPDPATMVRLGNAYNEAKQPDEAVAILDKVLAIGDVHPSIKSFAQQEKLRAAKIKEAAAAPPKPAQQSNMPQPVAVPVSPKP